VEKLKKLTDFQTPFGATGNIFSLQSWLGLIVGSLVLIIAFATAQNIGKRISGRVPAIDTNIDPIWSQPAPMAQNKPIVRVL
jgi:hypothetical protein